MQFLLLHANQTVVGADIEISIGEGERGYVGGGQPSSTENQRSDWRSYTYKPLPSVPANT